EPCGGLWLISAGGCAARLLPEDGGGADRRAGPGFRGITGCGGNLREGAIKSESQFLLPEARKRRTNDECDMECGDLWPLSFRRPGHSGDKSPHSTKIVIVHLHLTKAEPEATRASNCTHAKKPSPSGE